MINFNISPVLLDNEYRGSTKTEDEMKKLTLEEDLTETRRAVLILTKGQPIQKRAVYNNLDRIFDNESVQFIYPILKEEIQTQSQEIQIEASRSIVKLLNSIQIGPAMLNALLQLTTMFLKLWALPLVQAWLEVFELLIIKANANVQQALTLAMTLTEQSQPVVSRWCGATIFGMCSSNTQLSNIQLSRVRMLCQDCDQEVRLIMASKVLKQICVTLDEETLENYFYEKILEMIYDSDQNIKKHSIQLIFEIEHKLKQEERNTRLAKILADLLANKKEEMIKIMSSISGPVYLNLNNVIIQNCNLNVAFINTMRDYALNNNIQIRMNFAQNIPAIISLVDPKKIEPLLEQTLKMILSDDEINIRCLLISGLHKICEKLTSSQIQKEVFLVIKELFKESHDDILSSLMPVIQPIIMLIQKEEDQSSDSEDSEDNIQEIFKQIVVQIEKKQTSKNWRVPVQIISELSQMLDCFDLTSINNLYNILVAYILQGNLQLRKAACNLMVHILSRSRSNQVRTQISNYINSLFQSNLSVNRIHYIYFAQYACDYMSRKMFIQHNFFQVFQLGNDTVSSVQLALIGALPKIRLMIPDYHLEFLAKFNNTIASLVSSKTKIVSTQAKKGQIEIENSMKEHYYQLSEEQETRELIESALIVQEPKSNEAEQSKEFDVNVPSEFLQGFLKKYKKRLTIGPKNNSFKNQKTGQNGKINDFGTLGIAVVAVNKFTDKKKTEIPKPKKEAKDPKEKEVKDLKAQPKPAEVGKEQAVKKVVIVEPVKGKKMESSLTNLKK